MELGDREIVGFRRVLCCAEILMPDPKARSWSSDIGPLGSSRTESRIDTDGGMSSRKEFPIGLELMETRRIEFYSQFHDLFESLWELLSGELDLLWSVSSTNRPEDFILARGIDPDPHLTEYPEDRPIRVCLHRVPRGESEGMRKVPNLLCLFSEYLLGVDVERSAEVGGEILEDVGSEETRRGHREGGIRSSSIVWDFLGYAKSNVMI